jgi:hypothetical protein
MASAKLAAPCQATMEPELPADRNYSMSTPQPDNQRRTGYRMDDDAAMDTFTVRLPRWHSLQRLFGRNLLIRPSDRVEALVLALAVVVSLLAAPIAAAVGTAVYDSRSNFYAEQAQTRRTVTATVIDDGAALNPPTKTTTARARWFAAGAEHTGEVNARKTMKSGDSIEIWVDQSGSQVGPPIRSAADEAVAVAFAIWFGAAVAAAALLVGTRTVLNRARHARWQHDFDDLVGEGHGQASQP